MMSKANDMDKSFFMLDTETQYIEKCFPKVNFFYLLNRPFIEIRKY